MATELANNLITLYDPIVKQVYQAKGFALSPSVRTKSGEGKTFKFPVFGNLLLRSELSVLRLFSRTRSKLKLS